MRNIKGFAILCLTGLMLLNMPVMAKSETGKDLIEKKGTNQTSEAEYQVYGGGYAITGQIPGVGYSSEIYDASNGLPTSDAMALMGQSDGHIWIGGYSGVIRYDGTNFERMSTETGLTSARDIFEDSKGRIWVGTNDNGVVLIDGEERTQFTYKEGLPSSSIRVFAEDSKRNIIIGTTAGLCYVNTDLELKEINDSRLTGQRILKLQADSTGKIYGVSSSGDVFIVEDCQVTNHYRSSDLGIEHITTILVDPTQEGKIYFGTSGDVIYYGRFGKKASKMDAIPIAPLSNVHWLSYDCNRVWVSSTSQVAYIKGKQTNVLDIDMTSGIELTTSDYQGNLWIASSTQGVMKVVTNNYLDVTAREKMEPGVVNTTCMHQGDLYIGTDSGIQIVGDNGPVTEHPLIDYIGRSRVRCIKEDNEENLWLGTYTLEKGLVCMHADGTIESFTLENGMPDNQVRCIDVAADGCVLAGTNKGLVVIKDGSIYKTIGTEAGITNTVFLTVKEVADGTIWAGSDGDGIYVINVDEGSVTHLSRDEGMTSDVILRIIEDEERKLCWVVTSNSIQYVKDGKVNQVSSFPYNNNYDISFDDSGNAWVMSSYGIYSLSVEDMLNDDVQEYRLDTVENGLPYAVTGNSFGCKDDEGNLFIPGRNGVIKVNINNYYKEHVKVKIGINAIYCMDEKILPDEDGTYRLPSTKGRIQIIPSVMDYTMLNPTIKMYLAGGNDSGVTSQLNKISPLEYTSLAYGDYVLHIQVLDSITADVLQDDTFNIMKAPRLAELIIFKVLVVLAVAAAAGLIVWRIMRSTVISRQYEEIRLAKEEAERANSSKSRFLANMSHEIRTPINTIMGMNEMVLREDATGVPKEYFMSMMNYAFDIRNATESLLGLINDLLDISKIESGKMHLVEQEYDVQDMLRSIVSMIRVRSIEKELTFDVVVDEIMPKRLYGDMGKIKQIVLNLLTNAVKYTEKGGFILNISMEARENDICSLRFSVKDTGIGVKAEDMEKLFTAYERLDEERNSGIQGTGLGLDISRRFAELMGGSLWCESVYGKGSEFILTLNQKIIDTTPIGVFMEHDDSGAKGPYVPQFVAPDADILVVDDTPMNLSVIKGLLKATKVFVTTSSSGEDAIDKIRDNHFDVVLLDHMMPGMDGIETVAKIREFAPDLPVYALTANATAGEEFYISKGFNGYLSKPVDTEVLEKTILKHLPESMVQKYSKEDAVEELTELPENMLWINKTEGISVDDGIKNSGGIEGFIFALDLFVDTIDSNAKVISEAYEEGNIRLYTIKVHALKSSARIIGARELSELAASLEDAGNREDTTFIDENTDRLLAEYLSFKDKLNRLKASTVDDSNKEPIPEDELKDAYSALSDVISMMDYDAVKMIIDGLMDYKLPEKDAIRIDELSRMLKVFDWDAMDEWLEQGKE